MRRTGARPRLRPAGAPGTPAGRAAAAAVLAATAAAQGPPDFRRDIRPILADNCYACHGPDAKQRQRGLRLDTADGARRRLASGRRAVVPGRPEASELVRRITAADPKVHMPPPATGKRLTPAQVATLRAWIAAGAPWARHWSFVPPVRPVPPPVQRPDLVRNPIDAFVLARLDRAGLAPSPEAARETLIRRLSFDLTGLPPALRDVDAFLADDRPGAWDRVVDRLLASPHYGEHMGRYWLDAARYGDTHGYHLDNYRSMWPYRDWVIAAFNADMAFDRFTVEQLAGDLLENPTNDQLIATGFNRCNPTTAEGGLIAKEYLAKYARDRVETTATVFLGLTARCATCHDHKFDPISQKEFYRLFAFFHSVAEEASDKNQPAAPPFTRAPSAAQAARAADLDGRIARVETAMAAPMPAVDAAQAAWERREATRLAGLWTTLVPASVLSRAGATMRVRDDASVVATGASPAHDVYEVVARTAAAPIRAIRLEALPSDAQPGKGIGRASHSNIVLTGFEVEAAPADAPAESGRIRLARAAADYAQRGYAAAASIDGKAATGWAIDGVRRDLQVVYEAAEPFGSPGGTLLRIRLRFESPHLRHTIGRFRLAVATTASVGPARLSDWHSIGPFPARTFAAAFATAFPPERGVDLDAPGSGLRWKKRPDLVDAKPHALPGAVGATYLYRRIESATDHPMQVGLGSDDGIKVWIDGTLVFERRVQRAVAPDQDRLTLRLRRGTHRLLVKVVNAGGRCGFFFRVIGEAPQGLYADIANALLAKHRSPAQSARLRGFFRRSHSAEWKRLEAERDGLRAQRAEVEKAIPRTMIMRERDEPRPTHVLIRGRYDDEGEEVEPGTPAVLPPLAKAGKRATRLDLARWLTDPGNPLTARVTVNRLWQQVFGTGIVKTAGDFGAQGEWPSHPKLLDWLATEFVRSGWGVKHMMRLIVTSATYRQSSRLTPELLRRDPENRLLARGPRFRLDGEEIRDNALALAGLLVDKVGGPSVKPYQPEGVWQAVGYTSSNTARFVRDDGEKLWRRTLYTFWKRTAPPPALALFDAPSRETCTVRRERTTTPLQALALWNDVQQVEAARAFAERILREGRGDDAARVVRAFRTATARRPDAVERATLVDLLAAERARFRADPASARALVGVGASKPDAKLDPVLVAAWTTVATVLLNLDATITKG